MQDSRRNFLKKLLGSSAAIATASSVGLNFSLSSKLLAQSSVTFPEYKALVCVFLYGGNDSYNMLLPTDPSDYSVYQSVRQNLAVPSQNILPINPQTSTNYALGMPNSATALHSLFTEGKLSFVSNLGPLSQPLSKEMIAANPNLLPPQLFSHNDQQSLWQSANLNTASNTGWGGRMADLIADTQDSLSMNLTTHGANLMQAGLNTQPFAIDASGPELMTALNPNESWNEMRVRLFARMLEQTDHPLERAYANKLISANDNNARLIQALAQTSETTVAYPENNDLAEDLRMVAKLIASQPSINQARQIYFVGLGGWDTHDNQNQLHAQLLTTLGEALLAFQTDLEQREMASSVTTFTLSEFGRTLTSNGDGTDHGWGGHQIIMGDAIKGGDIFGVMPALELDSAEDVGGGRMLPSLSVEQYANALCQWFGLSESESRLVFPNYDRFDMNALSLFT